MGGGGGGSESGNQEMSVGKVKNWRKPSHMVSSFKTLSSPQLRATPRGESLVLLSPLLIFACLCSASFLQCAGEGEVPWLAPPLALETAPGARGQC